MTESSLNALANEVTRAYDAFRLLDSTRHHGRICKDSLNNNTPAIQEYVKVKSLNSATEAKSHIEKVEIAITSMQEAMTNYKNEFLAELEKAA